MKVFNTADRNLTVERWTLFPKSTKCVNQQGKILDELPDEVAYGPIVSRLSEQGILIWPGQSVPPPSTVVPTTQKRSKVRAEAGKER